ncbi:hypothetical protein KDK95_02010 [Actinospica sp. MGRD01-02]|uniref:Uncharacterized protein n=1 Tax=Actinospica acidithermotolerans TaxID=2828514 RepID=A0A941EBY8_9ACTN|nr:hypothetical protein [Actinospica acidithermotolerans]MBR7825064.1 hypothetical protein [Actinospica acidithermotolerans]
MNGEGATARKQAAGVFGQLDPDVRPVQRDPVVAGEAFEPHPLVGAPHAALR